MSAITFGMSEGFVQSEEIFAYEDESTMSKRIVQVVCGAVLWPRWLWVLRSFERTPRGASPAWLNKNLSRRARCAGFEGDDAG